MTEHFCPVETVRPLVKEQKQYSRNLTCFQQDGSIDHMDAP